MKWSLVPYDIPGGNLLPGQAARLRRTSDGLTVSATVADGDGVIAFEVDGNPGPTYVDIFSNGFQFIGSSQSAGTTGVVSLEEIPQILQPLGDVVLRDAFGADLAPVLTTVGGLWVIIISTGAMLVRGLPFVNYIGDAFAATAATLGRKDRVVVRLTRAGTFAGKTELAVLRGTDSASPTVPAVTQDATTWEVPLATVTLPAGIGTPVVTDERVFLYDVYRSRPTPPASVTTSSADVTTANTSGVQLFGTTLTLPTGVEALVIVDAHGYAPYVAATADSYSSDLTFGTLGSGTTNFNAPQQITRDSSGNLYIADYSNNRLKKHDSAGTYLTGITGLTSILGVCVDASGNIYVSFKNGTSDYRVRKYNSALTLQWTSASTSSDQIAHLCTDGTYVYASIPSLQYVVRYLCATGVLSGLISTPGGGSGDGQVNGPTGLVTDGTYLYVTEQANDRVQKFTTAGAYVAKWGTSGAGNGQFTTPNGIAINPVTGNIFVADYARSDIQEFTTTGAFVRTIGTPGSSAGQLAQPTGVVLSATQQIYVADGGNYRVQRFALGGAAPASYGTLAVEIDGLVSGYIGLGAASGEIENRATSVLTGTGAPRSVSVYGKATSGTFRLQNARLDARVITRR